MDTQDTPKEGPVQLTLDALRAKHAPSAPAEPEASTPTPAPAEKATSPSFRRGKQQTDDRPRVRGGATKATVDLIIKMIGEREGAEGLDAVRAKANRYWQSPEGMTQAGASSVIEDLKKIDRTDAQPAPARGFRPRPNEFAGKCEQCSHQVGAREGLLLGKDDHDNWAVSHKPGECVPSDYPFPLGSYAVEVDGVMKFYAFTEDGVFAQASDELHPLTNAEHIRQIIALIAEDPLEASKRYGREKKQCGRCGRTLTSEWRKVGIGPVCSKKEWG